MTQARLPSIRFYFLTAGLFVYALCGTPTPDAFGLPEALVGICLAAAAGGWQTARWLRPDLSGLEPWERSAQFLLLFGLTVPVITGVAAGNGAGAMLRDILAFLFLLLPLFMNRACAGAPAHKNVLAFLAVFIGVAFAVRVLAPALLQRQGYGLHLPPPDDPFYLANAPTVLFAALLLAGMAIQQVYGGLSIRRVFLGFSLLILALVPMIVMMLITQRASIGAIILSVSFWLFLVFMHRPGRAFVPVLLVAFALWAGWDGVSFVAQEASRKTAMVGLNMRWAEAMAVADQLTGSFWSVLFGKGWGATVASPAVGGVIVNFTHSLITTYWLKTGLLGLSLVSLYFCHMGIVLLRLLRAQPVLAVALAGPLLIDIFLYASFKSLDFGLVLLLLALWADRAKKLHKNSAYSMQGQSI